VALESDVFMRARSAAIINYVLIIIGVIEIHAEFTKILVHGLELD